ncbi:MAG TPA: peptidoglycan editing factor PgeF [Edaphobacter sp.]|jgi:YfiH family protein|nr:peptidoglycan editing factor PgeF [Edaphobacter sp.]
MAALEIVKISRWTEIPWLRHGFSTRKGGVSTVYGGESLNLGWTREDDPTRVAENRMLLRKEVSDAPAMPLVTVRQVHSNRVLAVVGEEAFQGRLETPEGKAVLEGDGLITNAPGVLLAAGTADCIPVLVVDPVRKAIGAFHAGWRGTAAHIVEYGLEAMAREYGSRREDMLAAIGPGIGACCYTVGEEVREQFRSEFSYGDELFRTAAGERGQLQLRIDLWEANRRQLIDQGVPADRIAMVKECTACTFETDGRRKYFSHRADAGVTGRMLNLIGISATA